MIFILFEFNIELTSVDRDNSAVSACLGSKWVVDVDSIYTYIG